MCAAINLEKAFDSIGLIIRVFNKIGMGRKYKVIANIYADDLIIMQYPAQQWRERKDNQESQLMLRDRATFVSFENVVILSSE